MRHSKTVQVAILLLCTHSIAYGSVDKPVTNERSAAVVFDISSVRINNKNDGRWRSVFTGSGYSATGATIKQVLQDAFGAYETYQLSGLPTWATRDRFDIEAKVEPEEALTYSALTIDQKRGLLKNLLRERFKLVSHEEAMLRTGYSLVVAKKGLAGGLAPITRSTNVEGSQALWTRLRPGQWTATDCSTSELAHMLALTLGVPVRDDTHLTAKYNLKVDWEPDHDSARKPERQDNGLDPQPGAGPTIFTALREQLGLDLQSTKVAAEIHVVDSISQPSEN